MSLLESIANIFTDQGPEGGHEPVEATLERETDIAFRYLQHEIEVHYGPEMTQEPETVADVTQAGLGAAATQADYEAVG